MEGEEEPEREGEVEVDTVSEGFTVDDRDPEEVTEAQVVEEGEAQGQGQGEGEALEVAQFV